MFLWFGAAILLTGLTTGWVANHLGGPRHERFVPILVVALFTLWGISGWVARRLARPLASLVATTRRIGEGDLDARPAVGRRAPSEVVELAEAIHEMADRIRSQMEGQRELLAAVSHEIRTPLGHLRILAELLRERGADPKTVDVLEAELHEADDLVDELLASSRLELSPVAYRSLSAASVARRALDRAGLPGEHLSLPADADPYVAGDPTLLGRALANLVDNAQRHGGGVVALRVRPEGGPGGGSVAFEVDDAGPGLSDAVAERAFAPFVRGGDAAAGRPDPDGRGRSSLGLGLALVARIAEAHGGSVTASTRPGGGARMVLSVPAAPRPEAPKTEPRSVEASG